MKKNSEKNSGTGFQPVREEPVREELHITRRNLPHWQMGGSTYFITFKTNKLELALPTRKIALDACLYFNGQRYTLWTAVVMPDHVHLLLSPSKKDINSWWSLSSILHSIKSFTANKINKILNRRGTVWQDESYDRIIRNEKEFIEKWNYIRKNPLRKGLCDWPEEWDGFFECTGKMPVPLPDDEDNESITDELLVDELYVK